MEKMKTFVKQNKAVSIVILIVIMLAAGLYLKGASHKKEGGKAKVSKEAGTENSEKKKKKNKSKQAAGQQSEAPANTTPESTNPAANQTPIAE